MLTKEQIKEIKTHLEKAQNPLFLFDNDVDGLCSFLLLYRFIERGKGVAVKSFPDLDKSYIRKVNEFKSDYVFVLDKPSVSNEFFSELRDLNIPCVWIDHHDVEVCFPAENEIYYYNPVKETKNNEKNNEPVTYLAYQITQRKKDLWLAIMGCLADNYLPDFTNEFKENYYGLFEGEIKTAFDGLFLTEIGKIARIINFALKDRTSNVVKMIKYLSKLDSPALILEERENNMMLKRFNQINKKYIQLIEKARKFSRGKILFFQYGGDISLSSDISNELSYIYPDKVIVVAYLKATKANVSLRGKNMKKITSEAIKGIENATGGGHECATGATMMIEDLPLFKEKIQNLIQ